MPLTDSLTVVSEYLFDLLEMNKTELGLEAVYYGDQDMLPVTPVACVEPDDKTRELKGAQFMTKVTLRVYILIYHGAVQSAQLNRRGADRLSEAVETVIHTKPHLDGLVTHGFCTDIASGYVTRDRTLIRANRITYEALSQRLLPATD